MIHCWLDFCQENEQEMKAFDGNGLQWNRMLYVVINSFVALPIQEVNKAKAETANPLRYSVLGVCLKGSVIDSDLASSQFRGNE